MAPSELGTNLGRARHRELSLVLPIYNEEAGISQVLAEIDDTLAVRFERYEILAVDDGSSDSTPRKLETARAAIPQLRILRQPSNLGYAAALIRGFSEARFELVAYTDADGQFDLVDLDRALPLLEPGVDLVAGYRVRRADPLVRRVASAGFNRLARWLLAIEARDIDCAFKLFRRSFFERIRLSSTGFLIDSEIYARARLAGIRLRQLPVHHRPRRAGRSTVRLGSVTRSFRELLALRRKLRAERRWLAGDRASAMSLPPSASQRLAP